ncbi:MAG: hypothetical protein M1358_16265 [Chloroflexi bacterium]|nr:hypothetical protein [Chloroflexota bacterium]
MEVVLFVFLQAVIVSAAVVVGIWLGALFQRAKKFRASDIAEDIRGTGWEARQQMDKVSDEYLRLVRKQIRR